MTAFPENVSLNDSLRNGCKNSDLGEKFVAS